METNKNITIQELINKITTQGYMRWIKYDCDHKEETVYIGDMKKNGENVSYYANGQVFFCFFCNNYKINGDAIYYNKDGSINRIIKYKNGIRILE